jgi:hypothetical protein
MSKKLIAAQKRVPHFACKQFTGVMERQGQKNKRKSTAKKRQDRGNLPAIPAATAETRLREGRGLPKQGRHTTLFYCRIQLPDVEAMASDLLYRGELAALLHAHFRQQVFQDARSKQYS